MKTRIHRGEEVLGEFELAHGEYVIGSGEGANIRLPSASVAPRHARLKIGTSGIEVEDLGSGQGTLLGALEVVGVQPAPNGSVIQIGDLALHVWEDALPVNAAPSPVTGSPAHDRYVIGEVVAQGAMGMIRRAHEVTTGREVAMKQMHERLEAGNAGLAARFVQEAKITAHLEHPNVVPVHDVSPGEDGPRFYTMKMVRGISLEKILELLGGKTEAATKKYSLEALLTVFQKVCDALAFAHSKGIIHRDLKPANIMVGEYGEVLVMDWGVAKLLRQSDETFSPGPIAAEGDAQDSFATMAGTVMGTPYYMAPEQARGELQFMDERSDVYALGAILYELLTLKTPVEGNGAKEVLKNVREGKIIPPLQRVGGKPLPHLPGGKIPASLIAVAMKALAFSPERRYQQVTDLQAEVRAFQSGRATDAEEAGAWRQLTLLVKRNKAVSVAIASSVILFGILSAVYTAGIIRERNRSNIERDRANNAFEASQKALSDLKKTAPTFLSMAEQLASQAKTDEALEKIEFAISLDPQNASYLRGKANILETAQRLPEAAAVYRSVLALGPDPLASKNLELCEQLVRENGKVKALSGAVVAKLQNALVQQSRTIEALIVGRKSSAAIGLKFGALSSNWVNRLTQLSDGTFRMDFSNMSLKEVPDLQSFSVSVLNLSENAGITDLKPLQGAPLKDLRLMHTNVTDISPLANLPLETLLLDCGHLSDLKPLNGMPLKRLFLVDAGFLTPTILSQFHSLELLSLKGSNISDLSPLRGLKLKALDISGTEVSDLSPLIGIPLEDLILDPTKVKDFTPLTTLALKRLAYQSNAGLAAPDIAYSTLKDCKKLETLAIDPAVYRLNSPYTPLTTMPNLKRVGSGKVSLLDWQEKASPHVTTFEDISSSDSFYKQYGIDPASMDLQKRIKQTLVADGMSEDSVEIAKRPGTRNDVSVYLRKKGFRNFNLLTPFPIVGFGSMGSPVAAPVETSDLSPLENWPDLEWLALTGSKIVKDITPLAKCRKLKYLYIDSTSATDLSPLRGLALSLLSINDTEISDLSPLRGMPLTQIYLHNTKVTDISPLQDCPDLECVCIPSGVTNLQLLKKLPHLRYLSDEDRVTPGGLPKKTATAFWAEFDRLGK